MKKMDKNTIVGKLENGDRYSIGDRQVLKIITKLMKYYNKYGNFGEAIQQNDRM